MTGFEIYIFVLCFIVFTLLTAMFTYLIASLTKMEIQFIRFGHRDEEIKKEKEKELNRNKNLSQALLWFNRILSLLVCLILIVAFAFAIYLRTTEDKAANGIPSIKVVKSESMSKKNINNKYLFENGLKDQFQMFDVVICRHLPAEEELKLYDIVVYKQDDMYIIHRIVGIEEPNAKHPNERHFLLQGDANERADSFPVLYSQMQGIYEGERIQFVGSFLLFLQSPAGWLCILLVVFGMIITPIVEKLIEKEKQKRLALLFPAPEQKAVLGEGRNKVFALMPNQLLVYKYADKERLCQVGTSVLDKHYQNGDVVDIGSLKGKKLISINSKRLSVIYTSEVSKKLTVHANSCSKKAYEAIVKAGGSVELVENPAQEQDLEVSHND